MPSHGRRLSTVPESCLRLPLSRVHSEFAILSVQWLRKFEKQGGGFDFIFLACFTSRSFDMLQGGVFLLFRCVFEAMLMVKINLGFINFFCIKYMFISCG
jgi:hypothetical protein